MHELTGELLERFRYARLTRPLHWGSGLAMQDYVGIGCFTHVLLTLVLVVLVW